MPKGTLKVPGVLSNRTIFRLEPVSYTITLLYMGPDRIGFTGNYRCKYAVDRGPGTAALNALDVIANQVTSGDNAPASVAAATPSADGGDSQNPAADQVYRVMVVDNHCTRSAENNTMLGNGSDAISKASYYDTRNWMRDIRPAVPFRAVIRRYIGDNQVPVEKNSLKLEIEVKDPVEEFAQAAGQRQAFMRNFFTGYNRVSGTASAGDDNQPTWGLALYKDCRTHPGANKGLNAPRVLRQIRYKNQPDIDQAPATPNAVPFATLSEPAASGPMNAKLDLTSVDENGNAVLVGDFALYPFPNGGDNFRFLLRLLDGDTDIRDTDENGAKVEVYDDTDDAINKPRCFTTGRLVIWRKVQFQIAVLCNNLTPAVIDWNFIQTCYREAFIEILPPDQGTGKGYYTLGRDDWRRILRKNIDPARTNPAFDNDANFNQGVIPNLPGFVGPPMPAGPDPYSQYFYPAFLHGTGLDDATNNHPITKRILSFACNQVAAGPIVDMVMDNAQTDSGGVGLVVVRQLEVGHGDLGEYIGNRHLNMMIRDPSVAVNLARANKTVVHELGHALTLRHAYTSPTGGTLDANAVQFLDPTQNCYFIDHDPAEAWECTMSYTGSAAGPFCGLCLLVLRLYDRPQITGPPPYGNDMMQYYQNGILSNVDTGQLAGGNVVLASAIPATVQVGNMLVLMPVGPAVNVNGTFSGPIVGRTNLGLVNGGAWNSQAVPDPGAPPPVGPPPPPPPTGAVTLTAGVWGMQQVTGTTVGFVRVRFSYRGVNLEQVIQVLP